jgi:CheY-like chemotaxis protein
MSTLDALKQIPPKRILVVDDEPAVASMIKMVLTMGNHTVEIVSEAARALEVFTPGKYDLVISDYSLGKMNGLDLAQAIKKLAPTQPFVLITAHAEMFGPEEKRMAHVNFLIGKPFSLDQLSEGLLKIFPVEQA